MSELLQERREAARVIAGDGWSTTLLRPHAVRLLEISMSGALLRSSHQPPVGQRGELRTKLGGEIFTVQVEIRRVAPQSNAGEDPGEYDVGVSFAPLDSENRRRLERFLRQRSTPYELD
jgi:hypothetical protein